MPLPLINIAISMSHPAQPFKFATTRHALILTAILKNNSTESSEFLILYNTFFV
jgi:hypothetical protein